MRPPELHYCFSMHSLTPPINNCLNLPFGTQGKLKHFFYKKELETQKGFLTWEDSLGAAEF